jgi:hypothetical protein
MIQSLHAILTISEVATATGVSMSVLRIWEKRYGWPRPHRSRHGNRLYTPGDVVLLHQVLTRLAAGATIRDLIRDGAPCLTQPAPRHAPPILDLTAIGCPDGREAQEIRDRLVCGLVQRHPGIVRWAVSQCARLRPAERGPAVLNVLAAYRRQIADAAWLDAALES